jgi:hypothetical protein
VAVEASDGTGTPQEAEAIRCGGDPDATALVAPALRRVQESGGLRMDELADLPEVRAIRDAPAELRRRCIIQAACDGLRAGPARNPTMLGGNWWPCSPTSTAPASRGRGGGRKPDPFGRKCASPLS